MEGPCEGTLVLTNPISDVTVAVGDTVYIDLANPPVFDSSKGRISYDINGILGITNIRLNLIDNPLDDNKNTLLLINGINKGVASIELNAFSGCLENKTTIHITII
jgi:hypothetical protein